MEDLKCDNEVATLLSAVDKFSNKCSVESEQCKYWENYLRIINTIKNLVRADREGDFLLHIKTVEELLPIFLGGDSINYLRSGSFYLELFKNLKNTHKDLYFAFLRGDFVVKTNIGRLSAVAPDMKLE